MATNPAGTSIDVTRIQEFTDMVHLAAEQEESRLRPVSEVKYFSGKSMAYDGLGAGLEAVDANSRFAVNDFADLAHTRRKITPQRWQLSLPWDGRDNLEALFDIQNGYHKKIAAAMMRRFDRTGFAALTGSVLTGENFETTVTAVNDGVISVDAEAGLTYEDLLTLDRNFIDNDHGTDLDSAEKFLAITGQEHEVLMKDQKLTSQDYVRDYFMEQGRMKRASGFNLIKYAANAANPMLDVDTAIRTCVAFTKGALCFGIQKEINIELRRDETRVDTYYLQATGSFGAVRTEGSRVQLLTTTEAS